MANNNGLNVLDAITAAKLGKGTGGSSGGVTKEYVDTQVGAVSERVDDVESVIPSTATPQNPLATTSDVSGTAIPSTSTTSPLTDSADGMVQSLTVYGASRKSKNLLEITAESQTIKGVTFTVDKKAGTVTVNGTSSETIEFILSNIYTDNYSLPNGSYYHNNCVVNKFVNGAYNGSFQQNFEITNTDKSGSIYIYVRPETTLSNVIYRPMLCAASDYEADPTFEPYLDGIKSVWDETGIVETTGKNLLKITEESKTVSGVTFTVDKTAGTVTVNGTPTSNSVFISFPITLEPGAYHISGCPIGGSTKTFLAGKSNLGFDTGEGATWNIVSDTAENYYITIVNGYTASNLVFKPMLCTAADYERDPSFQPYLSTSATFNHTLRGIDDLRDELTVTQSGGEVTAKCAEVDLGDFDYKFYENLGFFIATSTLNDCVFTGKNYGVNALCSNYNINATATTDKMSDMDLIVGNNSRIESAASLAIKDSRYTDAATFKAAVTGVKLVYPLATPTVTPLTSTELAQFRSLRTYDSTTNTAITDEPDFELDYLKNTDNGQAVADIQTGLQEQLDGKITVSPLLTLTTEGWDSTTNRQTVTFAHDLSRRSVIDITLGENAAWDAAGVYAVSETADSITFECSSIPESALTFRVTSMEVS